MEIHIRSSSNDSEEVILGKAFSEPASTAFSEQLSLINIEVEATADSLCTTLACETWEFTNDDLAKSGVYSVNAFRDLGPDQPNVGSTISVVALSNRYVEPGRIADIVRGDDLTVFSSTGEIWTVAQDELTPEFETPAGERYTRSFPVKALEDMDGHGSSDGTYGLAWEAPFYVTEWGPSFGQRSATAVANLINDRVGSPAIAALALSSDTNRDATDVPSPSSGFAVGAALLTDGAIAIWSVYDEGTPTQTDPNAVTNVSTPPLLIEAIDTAVQIDFESQHLMALLDDGTVVRARATEASFQNPTLFTGAVTPISGLTGVASIAGRRAMTADGQVLVWQAATAGAPMPVPGIADAVELPDSTQNIARLQDGSLVGWRFEAGDAAPSAAYPISLGPLGDYSAISGDYVVDSACGRLWTTDLTGHQSVDSPGPFTVSTFRPLPGFGGELQGCSNGQLSDVVFIYRSGGGFGSITAQSGTTGCALGYFSPGGYCYWVGSDASGVQFTAVPDSDSAFRDWRWDCGPTTDATAAVNVGSAGLSGQLRAYYCKAYFSSIDGALPESGKTLSVSVTGGGSVTSDPAGIDCGAACAASFQDGGLVTLTAVPDSGSAFDTWSDSGCTADLQNASIVVSMDADKQCAANFIPATSGNTPPVASFTSSPQSPVEVGTTVTFDASASSDADGNIVSWLWDFENNGALIGAGEIATYTYTTASYRVVKLIVTDNDGLTAETTGIVDVASMLSAPPVAAFTIVPGATAELGTTFTFDSSSSSDDVGIIARDWYFDGNMGVPDVSGELATFTPGAVGDYDIRLRVTDSDGQFVDTSQAITVTPPPMGNFTLVVELTGPGGVVINPIGVTLPDSSCDGVFCYVTDIAAGTALTLDASPAAGATFLGWDAVECDDVPGPTRCLLTMDGNRAVMAGFQ